MPPYKFVPYTPSSKIDCPYCKRRKKFTLFYDLESGEIMDNEFGRCDREEGCNYYKHPASSNEAGKEHLFHKPIELLPQKYINKDIVIKSMEFNVGNNFINLLIEIFGEEKVRIAINKYFIGTAKNGGIGYYCINEKKLITSCKIISYDGLHRDKNIAPYYPFKTSDGYYPCLFGAHLIDHDRKIKLVESEKTAFIASIVYPDLVWLSCGGSSNMTSAKCKIFKDLGYKHPIDIIPDCDKAGRLGALKWQENLMAHSIQSKIVDLGEEYTNGEDLADLILLNMREL